MRFIPISASVNTYSISRMVSQQKPLALLLLFCFAYFLSSNVNANILDIFGKVSLADSSRIAFIASSERPQIAAIDTHTQELSSILELPEVASQIVISDKLDLLVATHRKSRLVTLVDLDSGKVNKRIDIGMEPTAMLLSPLDYHLAFGDKDGNVSVWDMRSNRQMLKVNSLESAENMTFGVEGQYIYVVESAAKRISVIDVTAGKKVAEISLGGTSSSDMEVSALSRSVDGYTGMVSITSENRLVLLNLQTWKVKKSIKVGQAPLRPYSTNDNQYILVPHREGKVLFVLSALTQEIIRTVDIGIEPREINTGWLDTTAFIMPKVDSKIVLVDLTTLQKAGTIQLSGPTDDGLVTSDTKNLFAGIPSKGEVVSINARSRSLSKVIKTPLGSSNEIEIAISNNICH